VNRPGYCNPIAGRGEHLLHLITDRNRSFYERDIMALHRARKAVFVDELGWQLRVRDGMEFDEYDDARAMHIVGFDTQQDVAMSIRVRPADDRSMLVDHFLHHLPAGMRAIDDGRTWEVTRGFCRERGLKRAALMRKAACMIAPLEIALDAGVDRYVGFADVRTLGIYYHVGWKLNLLGEPKPYGEGDGVAYEAEVSSSLVRDIRRTWGLPDPAYIEINDLGGEETVHAMAERIAEAEPLRRQLMAPAQTPAPQALPSGSLARGLAALAKTPIATNRPMDNVADDDALSRVMIPGSSDGHQ
jgi:acyl homoserine lactone synthase